MNLTCLKLFLSVSRVVKQIQWSSGRGRATRVGRWLKGQLFNSCIRKMQGSQKDPVFPDEYIYIYIYIHIYSCFLRGLLPTFHLFCWGVCLILSLSFPGIQPMDGFKPSLSPRSFPKVETASTKPAHPNTQRCYIFIAVKMCLRWEVGDVFVPIWLMIMYTHYWSWLVQVGTRNINIGFWAALTYLSWLSRFGAFFLGCSFVPSNAEPTRSAGPPLRWDSGPFCPQPERSGGSP